MADTDDERALAVLVDPQHARTEQDFISYMHAVLCQVGLPRKKVDGLSFERTQRGASLLVEAGKMWNGREWVQQPLPYGPKPRVMLADLLTYAVVHRTRVIPIENNVTSYLRRLGWTKQGGARGPLTAFRNQAQALSVCHLTLGVSYGMNAHQIGGQPIRRFSAWFDDRGGQRTMWPGEIELTRDFYESLVNHAVPLDSRALAHLSGSALALDVYTWLAYRLHQLRQPLTVWWKPLRAQFGQEYASTKDFKKKFVDALTKAIAVYPAAARTEVVPGGVSIHPAPPPVRPVRLFYRHELGHPAQPPGFAEATETVAAVLDAIAPPKPKE